MRTWEYMVVEFSDEPMYERHLNKLGAQGWELVQFVQPIPNRGTLHDRAIFKRPTNKPDAPPPRRVF